MSQHTRAVPRAEMQELKAENDNLRLELKAANDNHKSEMEALRKELRDLKNGVGFKRAVARWRWGSSPASDLQGPGGHGFAKVAECLPPV